MSEILECAFKENWWNNLGTPLSMRTSSLLTNPLFVSNFFLTPFLSNFQKRDTHPNIRRGKERPKNECEALIAFKLFALSSTPEKEGHDLSTSLIQMDNLTDWSLKHNLMVVSATFVLVYFSGLNESTCQTRKNVFYFTSKALSILEKIQC